MEGEFGVFDHTSLLAWFGSDVDADEWMRSLEGHYIPQYQDEMRVATVPENYDLWARTLTGLRASRSRDIAEEAAGRNPGAAA